MNKEQDASKIQKLARDVLVFSRNILLVNLRFLDSALSQLVYVPISQSTFLTDGKHMFYNPLHVLKNYKTAKEIPARDYLHIVMHCVFRHMYVNPKLNRCYWDLACDIAVENIISELGVKYVYAERENKQQEILDKLKDKLGKLTAEKIYYVLTDNVADENEADKLREIFYADNHEIWYMTADEIRVMLGIPERGDGDIIGTLEVDMQDVWKGISEHMQTDMETFAKKQGDKAGALIQNLKEINREKYDYSSFLRKFAVMGEVMKVNDDEFDYIYYTYGMKLYDKMPLVEPLEYKDVKRIKEFVIAIDTSGSVAGEIVQKFVQKTYNILKSTESFFTKINLHIIQCDTKIQEDIKITSQEDFDNYLKTMRIYGLGGTDFRPVFEHVDKLINEKEFSNLKGLIYFTDGIGFFPKQRPKYEAAFVFIDDKENNYDVPPWAIKLILKKDEI